MRILPLLLPLLLLALWPVPAGAHVVAPGADLRIAQTIAGAELTITVRGVSTVPAPAVVEIEAFHPVPDLPVELALRSTETGGTSRAAVRLAAGRAGPYRVSMQVLRAGPHELEVSTTGERSVLPVRVLVPATSPWELVIHGGFYVAGILVVGGLLAGGTSRRGSAVAVRAGAVLGVVALTVAVMSPQLPEPVPDGAAPVAEPDGTGPGGRPYLMAAFSTQPARPSAGAEFTLLVDLVDGSTGRPVDDLALHHEALAHLVVTSADGAYFRHLHPVRLGPGRLAVRLRADRPGRYLTHAELERTDSGGQLVTGAFDVAGTKTAPGAVREAPSEAASEAPSEAASAVVPVEPPAPEASVILPPRPVAGRPATIELRTTGRLQPWLGMPGHLIVRDQAGAFLGHVHATPTPTSALTFTYSFPAPGTYLAWAQYATNSTIETVPFTITVGTESET
ncbi:hypothetical protein [Nonomuraea gerenzanensis]|uniref:Putative secreted protein n=1 Tax=Nonomuraea gerenzanensis TaxID=93944 RepID=A0A1M4E8D2_9ACTN|nr:hypothetical protein [Nonomuraea gerenzanensis]UBU17378.1 hypothetical protein LCN96_20840 [Nonomuraea gerenzanensis]SBO95129.1 Putative secreted protein [Nonomuraea gerenzanensis]